MRQACGVFFGKGEILVKLRFKGLNYHNFTFSIITNFKTDRYLNNFQEHLGPLYTSPGWLQPASEGQLFYGQPAISIYMTAGADPGQPFLPGNPSRDPG